MLHWNYPLMTLIQHSVKIRLAVQHLFESQANWLMLENNEKATLNIIICPTGVDILTLQALYWETRLGCLNYHRIALRIYDLHLTRELWEVSLEVLTSQ